MRRLTALITAMVLALGGVVVVAAPAHAATLTVTSSANSGFGTLRNILDGANSGDEIVFADGISTITLANTITIPIGVTIDGGGDVVITASTNIRMLVLQPGSASQDFVLRNITFDGNGVVGATALQATDAGGATVGDITLDEVDFLDIDAGLASGGALSASGIGGTVEVTGGRVVDYVGGSGAGAFYIVGSPTTRIAFTDILFRDVTSPVGAAIYISSAQQAVVTLSSLEVDDITTAGSPGAVYLSDIHSLTVDAAGVGPSLYTNLTTGPGGAFYISETVGDVTVRDTTFSDSTASAPGTAMYLTSGIGGDVIIEDSRFIDLDATAGAGAIYATGVFGGLSITGSTFTGNTGDGPGGAINATIDGAVTIESSTFRDNDGVEGGAIRLTTSAGLAVRSSTFDGNHADVPGGAFSASVQDDVEISDTTITDNTSGVYAAVYLSTPGGGVDVDILRSTISGNSWDQPGSAAFHVTSGGLAAGSSIVDSTFSGNRATTTSPTGGLSFVAPIVEGDFEILDSTFDETLDPDVSSVIRLDQIVPGATVTLHGVTARGAGVLSAPGGSGTLVVSHSILQSTSASFPTMVLTPDLDTTLEWSILGDALPANVDTENDNLFSTDPMLSALADNGGPTRTRMPLLGSPAIDGGDPAASGLPANDQRGVGFSRVVGGTVDIGAVEWRLTPTTRLPDTGQEISVWLLPVAGGLLLLGVVALLVVRPGRGRRRAE